MSNPLSGWTIVFDLDGTLVESAPDLHAALNHTLAQQGLGPIDISEIRHMIGDGAKALIRKGFHWHDQPVDEGLLDELLWPTFIDHYKNNICNLSHLYAGAQPVLDRLAASGAILAVCTNKAQDLAESVLAGLAIDHYFASTLGGDKAASKKPDGSHILEALTLASGQKERTIMVGDSPPDERAARDAGLPFIFVSFGYGSLSAEPAETTQSVDHWDEMECAINSIINTD